MVLLVLLGRLRSGVERWGGAFEMAVEWTLARESQFESLRSLLVECDRDGARAAVVTGVTGTGKTVFVERFAGCAASAGVLVLTSAGSWGGQGRALGVLQQLLAEHVDGGRIDVNRPSGEWSLSMECAFSTLINLASSRTVLLVIDDAHLSDTVSLFCVIYFFCKMSSLPIMILLAGSAELATAGQGVIPVGRGRHVALEPFSELEVRELADMRLGRGSGAAFARACHAASGGNPRLVDALLSDRRHLRHPDGVGLGEGFASAMHRYLDSAPSVLREVIAAAAVMGADATPSLISDATRIDAARVASSLRALKESGILTDTGFRHAGVRELILSQMDKWDRVRLHRRAVDYLWRSGGAKEVVKHHIGAISRLCDESLRSVLERCDCHVVDTADVDLALRCLDCAMYAGSSQEWVHVTDRPAPEPETAAHARDRRRRLSPVPAGHLGSGGEGSAVTVDKAPGRSGLLALEPRAGPGGGRWPERVGGPGPDAAIAKLSGAESRVAFLAARGHTNKAISVILSVTVSTVEQHLTRVYRKLNIQDRRELCLISEWPTSAIPVQRPALRGEKKS